MQEIWQHTEKFIPVCIEAIVNNKNIPIYGDGNYTRDWLYVEDHAHAIKTILEHGKVGETYNIGEQSDLPSYGRTI